MKGWKSELGLFLSRYLITAPNLILKYPSFWRHSSFSVVLQLQKVSGNIFKIRGISYLLEKGLDKMSCRFRDLLENLHLTFGVDMIIMRDISTTCRVNSLRDGYFASLRNFKGTIRNTLLSSSFSISLTNT